MKNDLYQVQEAIEQQSRAATIQRFEADLTDKIQKNEQSATYYGTALLKHAIEPTADRITALCEQASKGQSMNRAVSFKYIKHLPAENVAYLTCRVVIDRIMTHNRLQDVALRIGQALEDAARWDAFDAEHPWLFKKILRETNTTRRRQRQTLLAAYNRYCSAWSAWSKQDRLHIGMKLIDIFREATGFVEVRTKLRDKNKTDLHLIATQKVCDFMEKNKEAAQLLNPIYMPMVVPPNDWTGPMSGGYLTYHTRQLPLIKLRQNPASRNYLEDLEGRSDLMEGVYDAINTIQRTPWQVNDFVLNTFEEIYDQGLPVGGLPNREDLPIPPSPLAKGQNSKELSESEKQKFKTWKKKATAVYEGNVRLKSKRLMTAKVYSIAKQFAVHEAIYFPHTFDFRGRAYPAPMYLNPQGNSLAKGLLMFADGKPLKTNDAAFELAVHGANCFGYDKVSLEERIDWVEENTHRILQAASDPLADLWWAKEADDPWCFLAFCKEWEGFQENGYEHVSFIPIAKDGSCSGLQHFSAVLRDPIGGQAVNLTPSETPADIYQTVIDKAELKVRDDLDGEKSDLAEAWLDYGLTRKAAKRCTMTRVYGSTLYSARSFVQEYITDMDAKRLQEDPQYLSPLMGREFEASVYLARHIWESINETVIAAKTGMDWLQSNASILARENLPILWTTLDGFPVMQSYPDTLRKRVKTKLGDKLVYLSLREEKNGRMDKRKQANGISPNWVHSYDGCHLRMTVNLAAANGVTHFAMVHDSFGCHAADIPMLSACLREAFIELYLHNDPLENFRLETQALTETALPMPPAQGSLDLEAVRKSEFFFS
jgi:DNA-directed RNA polymerase